MTKKNENIEILDDNNHKPEMLEESEEYDQNTSIDEDKETENKEEINDDFEEKENSSEENFQDQIELLRDEKLRLLAEMDNLRKRTDRERLDSIRYGSINLARDILSPEDNLTRALEVIPEEEKNSETIKNLIDGLKMVQKEFATILEKHGVRKIESLNNKYDHNLHQAMVEIENDQVEAGTVVQEMQSGYTMHDRLLRPSMVGVSKKSIKGENNEENEENEVKD
jgi:molecular chaperone GrpE